MIDYNVNVCKKCDREEIESVKVKPSDYTVENKNTYEKTYTFTSLKTNSQNIFSIILLGGFEPIKSRFFYNGKGVNFNCKKTYLYE